MTQVEASFQRGRRAYVIIGNGIAGVTAAETLRTEDSNAQITIIANDSHPVYYRPALKDYQQVRAAAYSMLDIFDSRHMFQQGSQGDSNRTYLNYLNATFLYGMDFASVGLTTIQGYPFQEIVEVPQSRTYRKVILKDGVPIGMLSLGNRKDALAFKRAIDHGVNLMSVASFLFNKDFNLNAWLDSQEVPSPIMNAHRLNENIGKNI
jgi:NAD(P)H-nitrite reductase large subunit